MNATTPHWSLVNIGSDNGLVPQATNHYLRQCWHRSMLPYGVRLGPNDLSWPVLQVWDFIGIYLIFTHTSHEICTQSCCALLCCGYIIRSFGLMGCIHPYSLALLHRCWGNCKIAVLQITHIFVGKLTIIGSDNGLLPGRHQAIIWTSAAVLSIRPNATYFNKVLFKIQKFSFKEMHLKMSSVKWQPFCLGLKVLRSYYSRYSFSSSISKTSHCGLPPE